ncbi:MAG: S66 peptidase family protein [Marinirhabdus sp.]
MKAPPPLRPGDRIGIVSTARKVTAHELLPLVNLIKSWGLTAVLGKTIGAAHGQYAGSDALRTGDLQHMMDNPNIHAIWCARGGYGTIRIIDALHFETFLQNPKWLIGYSDVTVLHSHLHNLGVQTLHGQMGLDIEKKTGAARSTVYKALFGETYSILTKTTNSLNKNGTATATIVGGNLSLLYGMCGSPSAIDTDGKILFIEDVDEYLYHVDRMVMNLKRNGLFNNLKALVVGGMSSMNDNRVPFGKTAEAIVREAVAEYGYPVCFNFPAGHVKDNRALKLGSAATLKVEATEVTLTFKN